MTKEGKSGRRRDWNGHRGSVRNPIFDLSPSLCPSPSLRFRTTRLVGSWKEPQTRQAARSYRRTEPGQTRRYQGDQCRTSARYVEIRIGEPDQSPTARRSSIPGTKRDHCEQGQVPERNSLCRASLTWNILMRFSYPSIKPR